jgi:hypothetical protein
MATHFKGPVVSENGFEGDISGNAATASVASAVSAPTVVTGALLTGLASGSAAAIASTDTILEALAKLQAQIDAL